MAAVIAATGLTACGKEPEQSADVSPTPVFAHNLRLRAVCPSRKHDRDAEALSVFRTARRVVREYGRVLEGYDFAELLDILTKTTEAPDHVIYVASDANLEATVAAKELQSNCYGGLPIEIGYCNGTNTLLNCLEYHKDSEINIAADDAVLLVARLQDAPPLRSALKCRYSHR